MSSQRLLSASSWRERLLPTEISPEELVQAADNSLRFAAVLLAVDVASASYQNAGELHRIWVIQRAATLRHHAGQLAFPGGKLEPHDADLRDTALREAHEEVGLPRQSVQVLGRLGRVVTPSGFAIVPFVGWVHRPWVHIPSSEVAQLHAVDWQVASDLRRHRIDGSRSWQGKPVRLHRFDWPCGELWGASGRMMYDLLTRLEFS